MVKSSQKGLMANLTTAWRLPDDCLTTAWRLPDGCLTTAWRLPHVREKLSTVHSTVVVLLLTTGSCVVTSGVGQGPSSITSSSFNRTYRTGYCSKSCLSERWFCSWTRKPPMSRFSCLKNRKMGKLDLYTSICCFVSKPPPKRPYISAFREYRICM